MEQGPRCVNYYDVYIQHGTRLLISWSIHQCQTLDDGTHQSASDLKRGLEHLYTMVVHWCWENRTAQCAHQCATIR